MCDYGGLMVEGNAINAFECGSEEFVTKETTISLLYKMNKWQGGLYILARRLFRKLKYREKLSYTCKEMSLLSDMKQQVSA